MKKISLFLFALLMIAGCSKSNKIDERVFGEWVEDTTLLENKPKVLTFMKDGTYTAFYPSKAEGYPDINDKGTFSVKEMPKAEKWKYGGCVIVLDSDYDNDFEIAFIPNDEKADSTLLDFYKIETDRNGNVSVSEDKYDEGLYIKR